VLSSREQLANEIRRYCSLHPDASDTSDGIAWWLTQQRFHETRAEIEEVAEYLVERGILEHLQLGDGSVLFRCRTGSGCMGNGAS
jgi:hypothetical protein